MFHWPVVFVASVVGVIWAGARYMRRDIASSQSKTKKREEEFQDTVSSLPEPTGETVRALITRLKKVFRIGRALVVTAYICLMPILSVHYLGLSDQSEQLAYMINGGVIVLLLFASFVVWRSGLRILQEIEDATKQTEAFFLFKGWVQDQKDIQADIYAILVCGMGVILFGGL